MELLVAPLRGRDRAHRLPAVALLPPAGGRTTRAEARAHADELMQVFGADNVYFEVQKNGIAEQDKANEGIVGIAREVGRPLVATGDVHYLRREDYDNHSALLCVQTKSTLAEPKLSFDTNEFYPQGLGARWRTRSRPGPRRSPTTLEIAERCNGRDRARQDADPAATRRPDGEPEGEYLRRLAHAGPARSATATRRRPRRSSGSSMELEVIGRMGFDAYFLIVWDFVKFAKDNGIAVGPGPRLGGRLDRLLLRSNITEVDPLAYGLLFERFLNPERVSMPDIDIDFSVKGRDAGDALRRGQVRPASRSPRSSPSARCCRATPRATPRACSATTTAPATGWPS